MRRSTKILIWFLVTVAFSTISLWQPVSRVTGSAFAINAVTPNLAGCWNRTGDPEKLCSIIQSGDGLLFVNEFNGKSKGRFESDGVVIASDWEGGLKGTLANNGTRIDWANNTSWERCEPPGNMPRISGIWYHDGKECSITQSGIRLRITNENDQTTKGYFLTRTRIETTDWPDRPLRATVNSDGKEIRWDNGAVWKKTR